ncbi:hypothetical protein ACI78V_12090 [Geodermatophilus sp. SYSU D00742]
MTLPDPVPVVPDRELVLAVRRRTALRRAQRQRSAARMAAMLVAAGPATGPRD